MITIQRFFAGHLLGAAAALAVGMALVGRLEIPLIVVFFGLLWFLAQRRWVAGYENLLLFLFVACAAIGVYSGAPGWLMVIGVVLSLGAWDLDHFTQRLHRVDRVEFNTGLGRAHLIRLGQVEAVGLVMGLVPLFFRARISFWLVVLLAMLAVIGISRLVAFVRKESDQ